jgi:hypothetical protein
MCLTTVPENRVAIEKPEGYRESDYELLFRTLAINPKAKILKLDLVENRKTDCNNTGGISTDFIGMNYGYPEADYATREKIALAHKNWQLGLIWALQIVPVCRSRSARSISRGAWRRTNFPQQATGRRSSTFAKHAGW